MSSRREKARAILLSALMVLSVFGMTVAFSGSAAAVAAGSSTITSGSSLYQGQSSQSATIQVNTSNVGEDITLDFSNLDTAGVTLSDFSVEGEGTISTTYNNSGNNQIVIATNSTGSYDEFSLSFNADASGATAGKGVSVSVTGSSSGSMGSVNFDVLGITSVTVSPQPDSLGESAKYTTEFQVVGPISNSQLKTAIANADADSGQNVTVKVYDSSSKTTLNGTQPNIESTSTSNNFFRADFSNSFKFEDGDYVVMTAENIVNPSSGPTQTATVSFPGSGDDVSTTTSVTYGSHDTVVNATVEDWSTGSTSTTITLGFNSSGDYSSYGTSDFSVTVDGSAASVTGYNDGTTSDASATLTVGQAVPADATVVVSSDGSSSLNAFEVTADNDVATASASPSQVTTGASETVTVSVTDFEDESVSYTVKAPDSSTVTSGSTSSNSFSFLADFNQRGDYVVSVTGDSSGDDAQATVSSGYDVSLSLSPSDPVLGNTVEIEGTLTDANGNGIANKQVGIVDGDDDSLASATTTGTGKFLASVAANDAGTYEVVNASSPSEVYGNFTVGSKSATIDVSAADGTITSSFSETMNVSVTQNGTAFDVGSYEGYLNITGPFTNVGTVNAGSVISNESATDGEIDWIRVSTNSNGVFNATLTVSENASSVSAALENEVSGTIYDGVEDTSTSGSAADTPASPDYVGSGSATVEAASSLNVNYGGTSSLNVDGTESPTVTVTGSDAAGPDGLGGNNLRNATVTLTGPGVDLSATHNGTTSGDATYSSNTFTFSGVQFENAGTATIEVVAYNDENESFTASESFDVSGDLLASASPETADVQSSHNVSFQVTNADGTPVNNRKVTMTGVNFQVVTESGSVETVSSITIDGAAGTVTANSGSFTLNSDYTANNGMYTADNVTFTSTGDVNVTVSNSGTKTVDQSGVIDVQGVTVYNLSTDAANDQFLVSGTETVNFTVTKDGSRVNGSELTGLTLTATQAGSSVVSSGPNAVNTTAEYDGEDVIQVTLTVDNSETAMVNVSVDDGAGQRGAASYGVVAPEVAINDTMTTEGLTTENVGIEVTDPRDGSAVSNGEVQLTAVNNTFNLTGASMNQITAGNTATVSLDANGTAVIDVTPHALGSDGGHLNASVKADSSASSYVGVTTVEVGEMTTSAPDSLTPNQQESMTFVVYDSGEVGIPNKNVQLQSAALSGTPSAMTDVDGVVSFTVDPSSGTIDVMVEADYGSGNYVKADEISVREQVNLSLTASTTSVDEGNSITFELDRADVQTSTKGTLTVMNADGDVTQTVSIDGSTDVTFEDPGNFTVVASKDPTSSKSFNNDSVDVFVADVTEPTTSVTIDDQNFVNSTSSVTVASATYTSSDYAIAIHNSSAGSPGPIIGWANASNGTNTDVTVDLDESVSSNITVTAMLHESVNGSAITSNGSPVTDTANITITSEPIDTTPDTVEDIEGGDGNMSTGDLRSAIDLWVSQDISTDLLRNVISEWVSDGS